MFPISCYYMSFNLVNLNGKLIEELECWLAKGLWLISFLKSVCIMCAHLLLLFLVKKSCCELTINLLFMFFFFLIDELIIAS